MYDPLLILGLQAETSSAVIIENLHYFTYKDNSIRQVNISPKTEIWLVLISSEVLVPELADYGSALLKYNDVLLLWNKVSNNS